MKNFFVLFLCFFIVSIDVQPVLAQYNISGNPSNPRLNPGKFIEGIEINASKNTHTGAIINMALPAPSQPHVAVADVPIERVSTLQFKYAQLLNCEVEAIQNDSLFKLIEDWWGTKYHFGGQSKSGIDCSAFSGVMYRELNGVNLPRTARDQYAICVKMERCDLKQGDLLFFNTRGGVSHVGYYLGADYFVHASTRQGVVISSLNEDYYAARFIGGGRIDTKEPPSAWLQQ